MDILEIEARPREAHGSRACRRLRRHNLVPAVIYGRGQPNVLLSLREADIERLLEQHAVVVRVVWDGQQEDAQIKELQLDPLGDTILHVDFVRISLTETVIVAVAVETHGEPSEDGVLNLVSHELEVECLPTAIPEELRVEVEGMEIGDDIRISDMQFPEGVRPVDDPDTVVVVISPPREVPEEEEVLPEELLIEPEVIRREAEEEEEEPGEEE